MGDRVLLNNGGKCDRPAAYQRSGCQSASTSFRAISDCHVGIGFVFREMAPYWSPRDPADGTLAHYFLHRRCFSKLGIMGRGIHELSPTSTKADDDPQVACHIAGCQLRVHGVRWNFDAQTNFRRSGTA